MNRTGLYLNCGMSVLALAIASELHAQEQPRGLEEIVVTAQKRAESAQEIPIAIDVITGDSFIREGVRDVKDIQKMSTELEINSNNNQIAVIGMRGMQQQNFQPSDPLTAVHVDGGYIASVYGLNGLMFDLERVEVLAGPQGTLYGRNSAAGAINLISKRPGDEFEANGMVEYGSENTVRLGGGVTMPFGDSLSMRLAAQKFTRDALFNDGAAEQDQWSTRLSTLWNITDSDELFVTLDFVDFSGTNDANTLLGLNLDARLPNGTVPVSVSAYANSPTLNDPYNVKAYTDQRGLVFNGLNQQEQAGAMVQYTHDFGGFSTVLQYSRREIMEGVSRSHTRTTAQATGSILPLEQVSNTAELRFLSNSGGTFEWVGGLFYFDSESEGWSATPTTPIINNGPDPITGLNIPTCPCNNGFFPNYGDAWSYAVYGQGTWTPESVDSLHLTLGARYSKDWKDAHLGYWLGDRPVFAFGVPGMEPAVQALFAPYLADGSVRDLSFGDNNREWDDVQWKVGVEYDLTDASMIYATVSTGYKSGAFSYGATPVLEPEEILAYEIGTKNQFLGNTLQVNASMWYYIDENFEAGGVRALLTPVRLPNGTFAAVIPSTSNVQEAKLAGVSSDIDWLATDNDQLGLSFTYTYSDVTKGTEIVPNCPAVLTCSLLPVGSTALIFNEGERLGDAPKWQVLGRYSHTFNFANGATLNPGLKYQWQSEKWDRAVRQDTRFFPDGKATRFTAIPSRGILDASLKFTSAGGSWDITAYGNNLTDELNIRSLAYDGNFGTATTAPSATYGHITGTVGEPRTYGIILSARFQ